MILGPRHEGLGVLNYQRLDPPIMRRLMGLVLAVQATETSSDSSPSPPPPLLLGVFEDDFPVRLAILGATSG